MDDNKQQWATTGLERFSQLEEKIFQTVEGLKAVRKEAETLREESSRLNEQINEQIREKEALRCEIDYLKQTSAEECEKLRGEIICLQQQLGTMHQNETETLDLLAQFEREREDLRDRVEKTLALLASLEAH